MDSFISNYLKMLNSIDFSSVSASIELLANDLQNLYKNRHTLYLCGNGGSAGNANHLANDFSYGAKSNSNSGLNVESLSSNSSVITCLANDLGFENIYSHLVKIKTLPGDILIVLSGSGNSPNIINCLKEAKKLNIKTYAILGFDGGVAKSLADVPIHFNVNDMQISEDLQLIVGHIIMQKLNQLR